MQGLRAHLDKSRSTISTELLMQASIRPVRSLPSTLLMWKVALLPMIPVQDFLFLFSILDTTFASPSRQQVRNISAVLVAEAMSATVTVFELLPLISIDSLADNESELIYVFNINFLSQSLL